MLTQSEPDAEMLGTVPGKELEGLAGLPPHHGLVCLYPIVVSSFC